MSDTAGEEAPPPDDTTVIHVSPPVLFQKGKFDMLQLREPRAGEVRKAEGQLRNGLHSEALRMYNIFLVSFVSGWPVPAVEMLPVSKLNEAGTWLARFTHAGLGTGES